MENLKMSKHILFVHIPKTAGTSFRMAAEIYFDKANMFYDYTPNSPETSVEVINNVYKNNDIYSLYEDISKHQYSFLSGHFNISKYSPIYELMNIVSFVREPVQQVISHYNHFKNNYGYDKKLLEFAQEERFRNVQSRILKAVDVDICGFIGLTEEYNTSIDLFNSLYDVKLAHMRINVKKDDSLNIDDVHKDDIKFIKKLNAEDIKLYNSVKRQFKVRKKLYDKKLPFTYGFIQIHKKDQISGIAFQRDTDRAIEIDIFLNEIYLETILAKQFRPGMVMKNAPRKGFVGFTYTHKHDSQLEGKLHAVVKETGQKIL